MKTKGKEWQFFFKSRGCVYSTQCTITDTALNSGVWALLQRLTLNALVLRNLEGMKNGLES